MIHAIRKLARTIHRRSVWQVLIAYVLLSWVLFMLASRVTLAVGLPAWVPSLTLLLLVAMLPLVVATTAVQGGLPGLRIQDLVDPNELPGLTPEEVHVIPQAHPLYGSGLLTWRNMVLGGVTAAALLVTSVVAYMTMWALGIGPVGSLLAQGVIQEDDVVLLSTFRSEVEDLSLALLVTDVFDLELARSSLVSVVRDGATRPRLVISGDVLRRGSGYVVSSQLATPAGTRLARFEETFADDEILPTAVHLTERVRERLGESLRTIREGERLAPLTTDSHEALGFYRDAMGASGRGDARAAMDLLREAVTADHSFAMAWHKLGTLAQESGDVRTARTAYQAVIDLWAPTGAAERTVLALRSRLDELE